MTILDFQDALVKDVDKVLKDVFTTDVNGGRVSGVNVYAQNLPIAESDEEDDSQFVPYAIVKLYSGSTEDDETPWTVTADIHFCIHDAGTENQGHRHVMVMCQKLIDRYAAEPLLDRRYRAKQDMEWALQDDESHPYFFGGVRIKFDIPKIGRRTPFNG